MIRFQDDIMTDEKFIIAEIKRFRSSEAYELIKTGLDYFKGKHDILERKRQVIGNAGDLEPVNNLPNSRLVDNQYRKMVIQKTNYLLGKPVLFRTKNEAYAEALDGVFDFSFGRLLKSLGKDSLNCGIAWLYVYYDEEGKFGFKRFSPLECIPEWSDSEHTELDCLIRAYDMTEYVTPEQTKTVTKAEIYGRGGIARFEVDFEQQRLIPEGEIESYFMMNGERWNWERIPLIPFKYNEDELPLINNVKSLQDSLNRLISNFDNNMNEDVRNTVLLLVNYDGESLETFRKNLSEYGVVKVRSESGVQGDLRPVRIEVDGSNYELMVKMLKKMIIENAMGYDAKDDRLGANANRMNIASMYSDIDLDASGMETEYRAAMQELLFFVNVHLTQTGKGEYFNEKVDVIFNRDMLINESEIIDCVNKSVDLSLESRLAQHPWVDNVEDELKRIEDERGADPYAELLKEAEADGEK